LLAQRPEAEMKGCSTSDESHHNSFLEDDHIR
jgi:hypothetical protein